MRRKNKHTLYETINTACIRTVSEHDTYLEALKAGVKFYQNGGQGVTEIYGYDESGAYHSIGTQANWQRIIDFIEGERRITWDDHE